MGEGCATEADFVGFPELGACGERRSGEVGQRVEEKASDEGESDEG